MKIYKKVFVDKLSDIECDICKNSCTYNCLGNQDLEFATLEANWGYGSKKDGEKTEIHMCENCFDKVNNYIVNLKNDYYAKKFEEEQERFNKSII